MIIRLEGEKIIIELDKEEFSDLTSLAGDGNVTYLYDRDTSQEEKNRKDKLSGELEEAIVKFDL